MNPIKLAQKLRKARELAGFTQEHVSKVVDLTRSAITQMELGHRSVSTFELMSLAKLYRQSISYFLDDEDEGHESLEMMLYRAEPTLKKVPQVKGKIEHYIDLCREGINLEKLLARDHKITPPIYNLPFPKNKSEAVEQGEYVSEQERKRIGLGNDPIWDVVELISKQGIWVSSCKLPEPVSGLFLNHSKTGMIILVNAEHIRARKRFSYAHEYAHALLDRNATVQVSTLDSQDELKEVRANAFAASFLVPREAVSDVLHSIKKGKPSRSDQIIFDSSAQKIATSESRALPFSQVITYQDIAIMAHHFSVSYLPIIYRLLNLNYINHTMSDALKDKEEEGKNYLRLLNMYADIELKEEKFLWDRELCNELVYLAIEAHRREEISRGKLIELGDKIGVGGKKLYDLAVAVTKD